MTVDGWGNGEWHDMAWGGGAYPYDPSAIETVSGALESYDASGPAALNAASGVLRSLAAKGMLVPTQSARGFLLSYTTRGTSEQYVATGVLE